MLRCVGVCLVALVMLVGCGHVSFADEYPLCNTTYTPKPDEVAFYFSDTKEVEGPVDKTAFQSHKVVNAIVMKCVETSASERASGGSWYTSSGVLFIVRLDPKALHGWTYEFADPDSGVTLTIDVRFHTSDYPESAIRRLSDILRQKRESGLIHADYPLCDEQNHCTSRDHLFIADLSVDRIVKVTASDAYRAEEAIIRRQITYGTAEELTQRLSRIEATVREDMSKRLRQLTIALDDLRFDRVVRTAVSTTTQVLVESSEPHNIR